MTGLHARGGLTVDLTWRRGRLTEAVVHAGQDGRCVVTNGAGQFVVTDELGQPVRLPKERRHLDFAVRRGRWYRLKPVAR